MADHVYLDRSWLRKSDGVIVFRILAFFMLSVGEFDSQDICWYKCIHGSKCKLRSVLTVHTESLLESFHFSADHIGDIKKLDPSKAHGHDMIRIRMLKLCGDSILKPLEIIFKNTSF